MQPENIKNEASPLSFSNPVVPCVTEVLKKHERRVQLENEVQEFLAKNKVTELKVGETKYPDGKIPYARKGRYTETSSEAIAQKNSAIIQQNEKKIKKENKKKPVVAKKANPENQLKPSPERLAEAERKRQIVKIREEAIAQGLTDFIAPCKIHGMTKYSLKANGTRCELCTEDHRLKRIEKKTPQQQQNLKRKLANRERLAKAIAENKRQFEAECINCGLTTFKIKTVRNSSPPKYLFHCKHCTDMSYKVLEMKRSQQRKEELSQEKTEL